MSGKRVNLDALGIKVGRAEAAYLRHMTELEDAIRAFLLHYDDGGWHGSRLEDELAAAEAMRALLPEHDKQ